MLRAVTRGSLIGLITHFGLVITTLGEATTTDMTYGHMTYGHMTYGHGNAIV